MYLSIWYSIHSSDKWMFLLLRTEHTFFSAFLPNPVAYSLFTIPNLYAKKAVALNCKIVLHTIKRLPSSLWDPWCVGMWRYIYILSLPVLFTFSLSCCPFIVELLSGCSICLIEFSNDYMVLTTNMSAEMPHVSENSGPTGFYILQKQEGECRIK